MQTQSWLKSYLHLFGGYNWVDVSSTLGTQKSMFIYIAILIRVTAIHWRACRNHSRHRCPDCTSPLLPSQNISRQSGARYPLVEPSPVKMLILNGTCECVIQIVGQLFVLWRHIKTTIKWCLRYFGVRGCQRHPKHELGIWPTTFFGYKGERTMNHDWGILNYIYREMSGPG